MAAVVLCPSCGGSMEQTTSEAHFGDDDWYCDPCNLVVEWWELQ